MISRPTGGNNSCIGILILLNYHFGAIAMFFSSFFGFIWNYSITL